MKVTATQVNFDEVPAGGVFYWNGQYGIATGGGNAVDLVTTVAFAPSASTQVTYYPNASVNLG